MTGFGPLFEAAEAASRGLPVEAVRAFDNQLLGALLVILDSAADPELDRQAARAITRTARTVRSAWVAS